MLIGTAGLLGGVIGPVIAPAEEVLAVSRSEMQKRAKQGGSGGKAAPLGTSERKPGPSKKTGGKGSGPNVHGKLPNKLDMSYPVPWGNGIYHENALGSNAGKLTIKGWLTYNGGSNKKRPLVGLPFGGKKGKLGWRHLKKDGRDIYLFERGAKNSTFKESTTTGFGNQYWHLEPDDSHGAGQIGMFYTNKNKKYGAGTYYDMRTHKKTPVDFRLTYMGGNDQSSNIADYAMGHETWSKGGESGWTVKNGKRIVVNPQHADGRFLAFSGKSIGVWDLGRGTDQFKLEIINHKTGAPMNYNGPMSFWDIDYGQALKVQGAKADLYVGNKKVNQYIGPSLVREGRVDPFKGYVMGAIDNQNKNRGIFDKQGTVDNDDPRGGVTSVVNGSSFLINFDRFGKGELKTKPSYKTSNAKPFSADSIPAVDNSRQKDMEYYGNWFSIGNNINLVASKDDRTDGSTGKLVSTTDKPDFKNWNPSQWTTKLTKPVKAGQTFYYALQTKVNWGSGTFAAGKASFSHGKNEIAELSQSDFRAWNQATSKKGYSIIKNLGFEDIVDKRLKVNTGGIKVLATQEEKGPVRDLTKDFTKGKDSDRPGKDGTHIIRAIKDGSEAALSTTDSTHSIRNKFVRLIIPVTVDKNKTAFNLTADQAAKVENSRKDPKDAVQVKTVKNADGSTTTTTTTTKEEHSSSSKTENVGTSFKGYGMQKMATIPNVAMITQNDQTLRTKTTWARTVPGKGGPHPQPLPKVTDTQGAKSVYVQEPGTNTWQIDAEHNYDQGDILPNQWLTYQLQFKLPSPEAKVGDKPSDNEISKRDHDEYVGDNDDGTPNIHHVSYKGKSSISKIVITDTFDSHLAAKSIKEGDHLVKPYLGVGTSTGSLQKVTDGVSVSGNQLKITIDKNSPLFSKFKSGNSSLYVRFRIRAKNKNVPENSKIPVTNIAHLETRVTQKVSSRETGSDGYDSGKQKEPSNHGTAKAKTNKVTNYLTPLQSPPPPTKDVSYTGKSGDGPVSTLNPNDEIVYTITQDLGTRGATVGNMYNKIVLNDTVDSHLKIESVDVQSPVSGNKEVNGNTVRWTADKSALQKYVANGGTIVMTIKAKYPPQTMKTTTVAADNTENTEITNDNNEWPNLHSNTVSIGLPSMPSSNEKTLVGVYDMTTGETQDPQSILDPRDDYRLTYALTANVENAENSGFSVVDHMPENTKLDVSSIQANDSKGLSISTSGSDEHTLRVQANASGKDAIGSQVQIDYAVTVEHESDWSDYYSANGKDDAMGGQMVYNNNTDTVDGNSYLRIPNTAEFDYGGTKEEKTDYFNMGVQLFDTQQVIIQDDDTKWGTNLEKSHYVDHKRNDKTAVTTAIMVQVPNYLKISTLNVANNFKEPKFERGETHMLRANNKLVHDRNLLQNPDFTKSDFATADPYIGEQKFNGNEPVDKQNMSGKTYWSFTKWSPETRFFKDYAKLKNMRDSFTGQVNFKGTSAGNRHADFSDADLNVGGKEVLDLTGSNAAIPNEVGIHLSNIYAYYDMIDRGTFGTGIEDQNDPKLDYNKFDDGKKMDYTLYGEVKGLAVDPTEKTNFDSETGGQPVSAWLKTNGYDAGKKTLQLKNGLGQGETAPVVQTWTGLDADKLTGVDTDHGYYSKSNTYRDTKLDPYLGKNPAIAEIKGHSVVLTNDKDGDETLIPNRQDKQIHWEKYKKNVINTANHLYSNPKVFLDYFDFNKDFGGKTMTRVLREGYELYAPKSQSGKAGQGMQEQHRLLTFNYYNDLTRDNTLANYQTTITSPDKIFDNGYTTTSNNELLDQDFVTEQDLTMGTKHDSNGVNEVDDANKKMIDHKIQAGNDGNWGIDQLIDTKTAEQPLVKDHMDWASKNKLFVLPRMQLSNVNYRFNQRFLANGKQAYDMSKNAYPKNNSNTADFTDSVAKSATVGGYRNYLKNNLSDGNKNLNYQSVGFGVGKATSINYNQAIQIYGHRYLSKNKGSNSSSSDEIAIIPSFSSHANGKGGNKINGFGAKDNEFVNNNDPDQKWDKVVK